MMAKMSVVILLLIINSCCGVDDARIMMGTGTPQVTPSTSPVADRWRQLERRLENFTSAVLDRFLPDIPSTLAKIHLSPGCTTDLHRLFVAARKLEPWALAMVDSSAKSIHGLLIGNFASHGHYHQCLEVTIPNEPTKNNPTELLRGKYCTLHFRPALPPKPEFYKLDEIFPQLTNFSKKNTVFGEASKFAYYLYIITLRFSVCFPSSCSLDDIRNVTNLVGQEFLLNATVNGCEEKETAAFSSYQLGIIIPLLTVLLLPVISGILQTYTSRIKNRLSNSIYVRILMCFSLSANFQKLMTTEKSSHNMTCLSGLRVLSMSWIILCHTYLLVNFYTINGMFYSRSFGKDVLFQFVLNGTVAVDTFFYVSGLLLAYVTVDLVKNKKKTFNLKLYLFHRYWRFTPSHLFIIGIVFLEPLVRSGPVWSDSVKSMVDNCREHWWANLIYLTNIRRPKDSCLPHTWYLSCDFQLYVFYLLVLIPLLRWPKVGLMLNGIAIAGGIITCGMVTYLLNLPPCMLFIHPDLEQMHSLLFKIYSQPYAHLGSYGVGVYVGYLVVTKKKLVLRPIVQMIGWVSAALCNLSVIYGISEWNAGKDPTQAEAVLYAALHRTAWSCGLSWITIACVYGYGGVVNKILSWKVWIPLGRLTFMAYLIHPVVQVTLYGHLTSNMTASQHLAVWIFFAHLTATYGLAFLASLLIESPALALEKIFLRGACPPSSKTSNNQKSKEDIPRKSNNVGNGFLRVSDVNNGSINAEFVSRL